MDVLLISGPTASGKSAAARALAERLGGEIINADALQVYRELRLLSARPSAQERGDVPHHLYGCVSAAQDFSAGDWLKAARGKIGEARARGHLPIVVGGTGLYFRCLTQGLAEIPDVPKAIRENLRAQLRQKGAAALHRALAAIDPQLASRLPPSDSQRILRGLEVFEATGIKLSAWQQRDVPPSLDADLAQYMLYVLLPPRDQLDRAADRRVDQMIAANVLDEVADFGKLGLSDEMPATKALGLSSFRAHLAGEISLDEARAQAQSATRRYIRRQITWIRTQMGDGIITAGEAELHDKIMQRYAP